MITKNGKPVRNVLTISLFVLAGAAAWLVLSAGQAGAIVIGDQEATTVNVGIGVANTGGNAAIGNASTNTAGATQNADADATGDGDAVATNTANLSNTSNGSASIVTGNAGSTGNQATNNTQQVLNADDTGGQPVVVDQTNDTFNIGIAVSNTGLNLGVGNISQNEVGVDQTADADTTGAGDAIAINTANLSNNTNGSSSIITGNANALGNNAINNAVQVVDADGSDLVVVDQTLTTVNFGLGFANSGLNLGVGNFSTNTNVSPPALATATTGGDGDAIASNNSTASNTANGSSLIATGNATGTGSTSVNNNSQTLDADGVGFVRERPSSALPLMLLVLFGLLFVGTPIRRLGYRRR